MSRVTDENYPDSGETAIEYLKRVRPRMAPGFSYDQRSLYRAIIDALVQIDAKLGETSGDDQETEGS